MKIKPIYILLGSIIFIMLGIVSVFIIKEPSPYQYNVLSVILAAGAAAFMVALPGTINVVWPNWLKASGSLGVFAVVIIIMFFISPKSGQTIDIYKILDEDKEDKIVLTKDLISIKGINGSDPVWFFDENTIIIEGSNQTRYLINVRPYLGGVIYKGEFISGKKIMNYIYLDKVDKKIKILDK